MSTSPSVIIYDADFKKIAYLENASSVSIKLYLNQVWEASFRLPANDGKTVYCQDYYYAEIYDGLVRVGMFRIMDHSAVVLDQLYYKEYHCEHVLGKLLDDVIFGYHRTADLGTTDEAIQDCLSYQTVENWVITPVGTDFNRLFSYEWENTNLLSALLTIPASFDGNDINYMWTWDDSVYPWILNLERLESYDGAKIGIEFQKNLSTITRIRDPRSVITRIYPLGYGDGENQLDITGVNPTGLNYIDSDTIEDYGVISYIWVDRRYKDADSLYSAACQKLEDNKEPKVTYTATAADLVSITGLESDTFVLGAVVRIRDDDIGVDVKNRIVQIEKPDVVNSPQETDIKISNMRETIVDTISGLNSRQIVDETVSQGSLNFSPFNIPLTQIQNGYPVRYHVWLPDDDTRFVRLNAAKLVIYGHPYRTYTSIANDGYISPDTYSLRKSYRVVTPAALHVGTANWVDLCESPIIGINTYQLYVQFGVLPLTLTYNSHARIRLLIRDDPVTGFSAEYYPDMNGTGVAVWRYMFGDHNHVVGGHSHHYDGYCHATHPAMGLPTYGYSGETWYYPYKESSSHYPGNTTTKGLSYLGPSCLQRDKQYLIPGNYVGKTIVLQAIADEAMEMTGYIEIDAQPLLKIETTPEINEPIDPTTSEKYYPENVEVFIEDGDGNLTIISDYALDSHLIGGVEFESNEIDFTDYVTRGHNTIEIRCSGKGSILGEGQIRFFQSTHAN